MIIDILILISDLNQEFITFYPDLVRDTEPYIKQDSNESDLVLPFHGFSKQKHPKV